MNIARYVLRHTKLELCLNTLACVSCYYSKVVIAKAFFRGTVFYSSDVLKHIIGIVLIL